MKKIFTVLVSCCFVLSAMPAGARGSVMVGGYDVAQVASQTMSVLAARGLMSGQERADLEARIGRTTGADPLIAAVPVVEAYGVIASRLVAQGVASQAEAAQAQQAAATAGGLKAAGFNPVVLAASWLDLLARKGIVTLQQAQSILDSAKNR